PSGRVGNPRDFPHFAAVREIFELPLATSTPLGGMCLDFHWELENAQMQAIEAQVCIEEPFLPGLPIGPFESDGIDESSAGAFHLDVPWTLSRPFRPSSLGRPQ